MNPKNNILNELNELGSSLAKIPLGKTYEVPASYFENLASNVLSKINEKEAVSPSFNMDIVSKEPVFATPEGYFEGLDERIMAGIRQHPDYQNSTEEILSISPVLAGLQKINPYQVPTGYFENISASINKELNPEAKVISITSRKWFRMAIAAVTITFFAMTGILYLNQSNKVDASKNPDGWISKNIKKLSTQDLDAFIYSTDPGFHGNEMASIKPVKSEYVKSLLEDVSDAELDEFLDETTFDMEEADLLLN
jgi:hypothetical protein